MIIKPYVSVGPVLFGQTKENCFEQLGMPNSISTDRMSEHELEYDEFIIRVDPKMNRVCECTLLPYTDFSIEGIKGTWDKLFLDKACKVDGAPYDILGFIVLLKLGIAVTGIHDDDQSQLAITVFELGAFDRLLGSGVPFV